MENEFRNNHYVPEWYQKRFVTDRSTQTELFRLELKPPQYRDAKGGFHLGKAVRRLGFAKCFAEHDLYTATVNGVERKDIETIFFGDIDRRGKAAIEWCDNFSHPWNGENLVSDLLLYMSTQKLRTPKGLAWLKELPSFRRAMNKASLLDGMTRLRHLFNAIWMECVWQIADADDSSVKFIVSDHPVTIYNRRCGPRSVWCRGANDPDIRFNASHTIFPLSLNKVLILTNLSWIRNPYQSEVAARPNPIFFRRSLMSFLDIQTLRHLTETEVLPRVAP